ncbi:MAG: hypothetical protein IPL41_11730 [Micropruina sp.]|nr:hypothetical protein [Micropruina sp.]
MGAVARLRRNRGAGAARAAIAFPYTIDPAGNAVPGWAGMFLNGAGVTYCMITPVVVGVMVLRPGDYPVRARWLAAYVGLLFGLVNAATWFGLRPASWWMGVLHLPLLIISGFALWTMRPGREMTTDSEGSCA